jgi:hypothetical protein
LPIRFGVKAPLSWDPTGMSITFFELIVSDQQGFVTGPADILNSMDVTTASKLARPNQNRKLIISELPPPKFHLPSSSIQAP